jgi:pimeloyl-ACP methyl ester carboxylesterase
MVRRVSDGSSFVRDSNCNGWRDRALTPRPVRAKDGFAARNVVLVHGLFADGSCWSEVIAGLQAAGLNATAVQNPLTTLKDAVAETRRVLARQDRPTVLVGHSFAGMIITEAGVGPKVSALVYVAARAPDAFSESFFLEIDVDCQWFITH